MKKFTILFFFAYLVVGLLTISFFPMIFIDEPWLGERAYNLVHAGSMHQMSFPYSQNYMSFYGDFFLLFNALSVKLFGYNIFALRLFPLLFFTGSLILLYLILTKNFNNKIGFVVTTLLMIHPFAINASRISRKEPIVTFCILLGLYLYDVFKDNLNPKRLSFLGAVFSIPLLSHAVGAMAIVIGLVVHIYNSNSRWKQVIIECITYIVGTLPVGIVFLFNFINNKRFYIEHARLKGTFDSNLWQKFANYISYLYSGFDLPLFHNTLFIVILILSILTALSYKERMNSAIKKSYMSFLLIFIIINVFLLLLSNFTRLYLIYILLFGLVLLIIPLYYFDKKKIVFSIVILSMAALFVYQDYVWVHYYKDLDYKSFGASLNRSIPINSKVLGNINFQLSFTEYKYFATEDLNQFLSNQGTFKDYIKQHKIQYIIYDYSWDHYQSNDQIRNYIKHNAVLISTTQDKYYSNRIGPEDAKHVNLPYFDLIAITFKNAVPKGQFWTKIYKVE